MYTDTTLVSQRNYFLDRHIVKYQKSGAKSSTRKNKKCIASVARLPILVPVPQIYTSPDAVHPIKTDVPALFTAPIPSGLYAFL